VPLNACLLHCDLQSSGETSQNPTPPSAANHSDIKRPLVDNSPRTTANCNNEYVQQNANSHNCGTSGQKSSCTHHTSNKEENDAHSECNETPADSGGITQRNQTGEQKAQGTVDLLIKVSVQSMCSNQLLQQPTNFVISLLIIFKVRLCQAIFQ